MDAMTYYAHCEADGTVVAFGSADMTLAEAQARNPGVTVIVTGAPSTIKAKGAGWPTYHKKGAWAGTEIGHYDELPCPIYLQALKDKEKRIADVGTQALIVAGTFAHGGQSFSLSLCAQTNWNALLGETSFPHTVSTCSDSEYILSDAAMRDTFHAAYRAAKNAIIAEGRSFKATIDAAADVAAVEAAVAAGR